jgi:hypothetical protein
MRAVVSHIAYTSGMKEDIVHGIECELVLGSSSLKKFQICILWAQICHRNYGMVT